MAIRIKGKTMAMDIRNDKKRKVLCFRNDEDGMMQCSENHYMLEIGKEYTISNIIVHSWYTEVYLEEFPNIAFNSVVFKEI